MTNEFQTGREESKQEYTEATYIPNVTTITLQGTKRCPTDARIMYLSKIGNMVRIKVEGEGQVFISKVDLLNALKKLEE